MSGPTLCSAAYITGFLAILQSLLASATITEPSPPAISSSIDISAFLSPTHLHIRANQYNLQQIHFWTSSCLLPPYDAAQTLFDLYHSLLRTAVSLNWMPSLPYMVFRFGQFELGFFSGAGNIEWDLVVDFAHSMLRLTLGGYASLYQTTWANPERTKAVSVALRLAQ